MRIFLYIEFVPFFLADDSLENGEPNHKTLPF